MNLPNKLTVLRICMIPLFVAMFYVTAIPYNYFWSAIIFVLASATDFLDGHIARKYHLVTNLGKFLDPIADKVLVSSALIVMLTVPAILPAVIGGICVAIILARELIVSGFRMVAASRGMVLAADKLGKLKTCFQDASIFVLLAGANLFGIGIKATEVINIVGLVLLGIATLLTIVSGCSYIIRNRAVLKDAEN